MAQNQTLVIIAIVAALGLLGLVVVESISVQQQAEAGCGFFSHPFFKSKGRCFKGF